jgi:hypothetical protein
VTVAVGLKRKRGGAHQRTVPTSTVHIEEEIILDAGDEESDNEIDVAVEELADAASTDDADDGREAHDEAVLKTIRGKAIRLMQDKHITISASEEKMALALFPRVWFLFILLGQDT